MLLKIYFHEIPDEVIEKLVKVVFIAKVMFISFKEITKELIEVNVINVT